MLTTTSLVSAQGLNEKTDLELVQNIKNGIDEGESIAALSDRHSGIYISVVRSRLSGAAQAAEDMIDQKDTFIYQMALEYDPNLAKFSTFLYERTRYKCLDFFGKSKSVQTIAVGDEHLDRFSCDHTVQNEVFGDERRDGEFVKMAFGYIEEIENEDVRNVLKIRYSDTNGNQLVPYNEIGRRMGFSHEWCRKLHDKGIGILKKKSFGGVDFL
jgi:DNA-directed RNA polymerase specialized sigma24 family protein